jgi:hypothetical protein
MLLDQEKRKSYGMTIFDEVIATVSKEVVDEEDNITLNLVTLLSPQTDNPLNLRNLSPPGYGKTYEIKKIIQYCDPKNIISLSSATAKAFKYHGQKMVEFELNKFVDLQAQMEAAEAISDEKEREKEILSIKENTWLVFDFRGKTLIFGDSQSFALMEEMKQVLSHDSQIQKSIGVNKSSSGTMFGSRFAFIGSPAIIYCSAKDEVEKDPTNEIGSRFITTSIKSGVEKNTKRHKITALKYGLPSKLSKQQIGLDEDEIDFTKSKVQRLTQLVKDNESLNPYRGAIAAAITNESPNDRELKNLLTVIDILTRVNAGERYVLVKDDEKYVLTAFEDIERGTVLTKKLESLPIAKIQFLNTVIKPLLLVTDLKAIEIAEKIKMDKRHLSDNYLKKFVSFGYLDTHGDRYSGFYYSLPEYYKKNDATEESSLITTSSLDFSCLKTDLEWWIGQGYRIESYYGLSVTIEDYLTNKGQVTTEPTQIIPKTTGDDVTKSDEHLEEKDE